LGLDEKRSKADADLKLAEKNAKREPKEAIW
jgi:hypothetical protein